MTPQVSPCQPEDYVQLAKQQRFALQQLQAILGSCSFSGTKEDFKLIQAGLDSGELQHVVDLQCLGVPLGEVFINTEEGFTWWMYEDDVGKAPCIRYRNTNLIVFPLTLISKRIEEGEKVNIENLFNDLTKRIAPLRQELDIQLNSSNQKIH